jgi:GPH family glycoside/pentoside/hexuronide:cation symporter
MGLVYSFVNIPYAALMALMTRSPHQKMQLSSMRVAGSAVGSTLVQGLTIPLATFIGFERHGFTISAAIFAAVSVLAFMVVFFNTRERFTDHAAAEPMNLTETFRTLGRNRTFLVAFVFSFINLVRVGVFLGSIAYFALDVLKQAWMISVLLPVMSISSIAAAMISPPLFRRFGIRKGNWVALSVGFGCFIVLPFAQGHIWPFLAIYTLANIALGTCTTAIWAMSTYAIDYQQWRFGTRNDGLLVSSISLSTKVGMAAGISLVAYVLAWAHFDPLNPGPSSLLAIRETFYGGSLFFIVLMFLCIGFYNMDKLHPEIVSELNTRSLLEIDPRSLVQEPL